MEQTPTEEPAETATTLPAGRPSQGVRSLALTVLAVLATLFALRWAAAVVVPVLLGLTLSYALSPLVDRLQAWRLPRALGAALVLSSLFSALGGAAYTLSDDAAKLLQSLPDVAQKVRETVRTQRGTSETTIDKMQRAAAQLEQAANEGPAPVPAATRGVTRVRIERPQFDIKDYLWTGTLGLATTVGQTGVVLVIAYFLMAAGDAFRRKVVRIAGPDFARRRLTVQALDEITMQIQRYLLVHLFTSVIVGIVSGLAFMAVGLEHAAVWGVAAGLLNLVPYVGSIVLMAGSAAVAFVQFGTFEGALLVAGVSVVVHTVTGNLLTPWLTSRTSRMNPVVVFVGVLAFGWLWGVGGLLLGVPILTTVKAVCDRVEGLEPVGELLGA